MGKIHFSALVLLTETRLFNALKVLKLGSVVARYAFKENREKFLTLAFFQVIKSSDDALFGLVFDKEDVLIAGDALGDDKKRFLSTSGSHNQIHFMVPDFFS